MTIDVIDLRDFYSQRLGIVARRLINRGIRARWPDARGPAGARARLSDALSRAVPRGLRALHRLHAGGAGRAEMADRRGRRWRRWSTNSRCRCRMRRSTASCWFMRWKCRTIRSACCARCGGCWRRPGRLIAVIPNRRGVWTRTDNTPFGHGRPYSRSQITQLLRQTWFTPTAGARRCSCRRSAGGWFLRSAMAWERVGAALSLPFAGVHIVEATKQVYRAIPAHRERTRLIPALEPVLVPSSSRRAGMKR